MKKNNKKGFTLAELLIVVAIIAVLTAVAIPIFTGQLNKSKYSSDLANARSIYSELSADYLANGGKQTTTVGNNNTAGASNASISSGNPDSIFLKEADGTVNEFKFNGTTGVTVWCGTATKGPGVRIDAYTSASASAQTFGVAHSS